MMQGIFPPKHGLSLPMLVVIMCNMLTCNLVSRVVVIATTVAVYVRHVHIDQVTCCTV